MWELTLSVKGLPLPSCDAICLIYSHSWPEAEPHACVRFQMRILWHYPQNILKYQRHGVMERSTFTFKRQTIIVYALSHHISVWTTICPLFFVFTSKWHQHQTVNNLAQRCPYIYCTFPQKQSRYDMYFNFLWKITVVVCAEKCPGIMFCNYCHKYYLLLLKLLPRTEKLMVNYDIYIIAFRKHFVTGARGTFLWKV